MNIGSFSDLEVIFDTASTQVKRGIYKGESYTLKHYKPSEIQSPHDKILKEYAIAKIVYPGIVSTINIEGHTCLVRPYYEGNNLRSFIDNWKFEEKTFLDIAIEIVQKIDIIHKRNVLHLDINPGNIIISPIDKQINIIDFGNSNLYKYKNVYLGNPERVECNLHYIAPEQTGRINRQVDFTSDQYAIGAVLYELSTGKTIFQTYNPIELVHSHIAKNPRSPIDHNKQLSIQTGAVILKMLSKNSEDRYQSNEGLISDLVDCRAELIQRGRISNFDLGANDKSNKLTIPQKLYGRDQETAILSESYNAVTKGAKIFVLVSGSGGTGKTNLVSQLYKEVSLSNGIYLNGKFDQVNKDIPYSAWVQVFNNFIELIITESQERLTYWTNRLEKYLGENLAYLAKIVPNLNWLFKDLDQENLKFTAEFQNRFLYALKSLIKCIASAEHPLIVFIDDWQWSDKASIEILNKSFSDEYNHLMLVCAYRANEVDEGHSFNSSINLISTSTLSKKIELNNLTNNDTLNLIEDTLVASNSIVSRLNDYIYNRTEGNPLFYRQFLTALSEEKLITFDLSTKQWIWDISKISQTVVSENIVDLLIKKVEKFTLEEQVALQTASSIGSRFELEILAKTIDISEEACEDILNRALVEGLIQSITNINIEQWSKEKQVKEYQFLHDRIQQGIYEMLSSEDKENIHYKISKVLLENLKSHGDDQNIFSLVEQLNKGVRKFKDISQLEDIAFLNLKASRKARILVDFGNALKYAGNTIDLIKSNGLKDEKGVLTQALLDSFQISYLTKNESGIEKFQKNLENIKLSKLSYAKFIRFQVEHLVGAGRYSQAIDVGLKYMAEQGVKLKKNPRKIDLIVESIQTSFTYKKNEIDQLINLPEILDPLKLELPEIFQAVSSAAYFSNQNLWVLLYIKVAKFYINNGLCSLTGFSFTGYAATLIIATKDIKSGVAFGKVALKTFERLNTKEHLNKVLFSYHALVSWWDVHISESYQGMQDALNLSMTMGDFTFVGHCTVINDILDVYIGNDYTLYKANFKQKLKDVQICSDFYNINSVRLSGQFVYSISDPNNLDGIINGDYFKLEDYLNSATIKNVQLLIHTFYGQELKLLYFMRKPDEAYTSYLEMEKYGDKSTHLGVYIQVYHDFFSTLVLAKHFSSLIAAEQKKIKKQIQKTVKDFKTNSGLCAVNFESKYLIIEGVYHGDILKDYQKAAEYFQKAIEVAKATHFKMDEALAWEECGEAFYKLNQEVIAKTYIENAFRCFEECGAYAISSRILRDYEWLAQRKGAHGHAISDSANSGNELAQLDIGTVLKSATALMGETGYEKLLRKLILIAVENAGAEKGYLLLNSSGKLKVVAYGDVNKKTEVYEDLSYEDFNDLPHKVINYVNKTTQTLILNHAVSDKSFSEDAYIIENQIKSIFTLPIINKGDFIGILYLENNVTSDAFTTDRVKLLNVLSGQIAISIENSLLIEHLEEKVKGRTLAIEEEKEIANSLLLNILPKSTASELKNTGKAEPKFYKEVSILFLDFKNFSQSSKQLNFIELVDLLDLYFKSFDDANDLFHIEKIKTIGDAYMCACGLPVERSDHAVLICQMALEMQKIVSTIANQRKAKGLKYFDARIGIHSGPVVAGVVGSKKFAYDMWGDTVNIASRIESACEVGHVAISEQTYKLVKNNFNCTHKGKVAAKNMDMLDMYYIQAK